MYNYYDFEAEFPLKKAVQKFLVSDYFHDSEIQSVEQNSKRQKLAIRLQCRRDWETAGEGNLDDARYTYILRFSGVHGFRSVTDLSCPEYINGRFKQTAWLYEQQKQAKCKLYQFRIGLADGYLDILFSRFSVRKETGRISYADITEFGAFYKDWYKRNSEQIDKIREALKTTSPDSLDDDLNLAFLYANEASDLSQHCRRLLAGDASQASKAYAAWLLGKCGTQNDLSLIWEAFRIEKERKSYDFGSDDPMKYRNYMDAIEQLISCGES